MMSATARGVSFALAGLLAAATAAAQSADLFVTKTAPASASTGSNVPGGNLADVAITKSGPASAPPNSDVTYTISVTNFGSNAATNVSWSDTLPAGTPSSPMTFVAFQQTSGPAFNCPSPGASVTCSISTLAAGATA